MLISWGFEQLWITIDHDESFLYIERGCARALHYSTLSICVFFEQKTKLKCIEQLSILI